MCPACVLTVVLIAAGTPTTGGLAALVVKKFRAKAGATTDADSISREIQAEGEEHEIFRKSRREMNGLSPAKRCSPRKRNSRGNEMR